MRKIGLYLALPLFLAVGAQAQTKEELIKEEALKIKKEIKQNYSNWSIGIYGGLPFTQGGDMATLAHDKIHFGYMGGLQLGYQFNPFFGLSLTGQYGNAPAGAKKEEMQYRVMPNGQTFYGDMSKAPAESMLFKDVYSKIVHMGGGLHFDFNVAPLFAPGANRKVALILSPAVYAYKFSPTLHKVSDNAKFNTSDLKNDLTLALGGDLDFRVRASKHVDVMLKAGTAWIQNNNNFDGIDNTGTKLRYGVVGQVALGVVYKIGNTNKEDNILYAPVGSAIKKMATDRVNERLEAERIAREKAEAERLAREKAEAEAAARKRAEEEAARRKAEEEARLAALAAVKFDLPTVHFNRGSHRIDVRKYKNELATIVSTLKENPTVEFVITGFCDHTGTEALNNKLAINRAEALKSYLAKQGVDVSRITTAGQGKDPVLTGKDALSIKARRVEVKN
ncbi:MULTISPECIES: OmpA family protein [Porphyromonas]|uniref:OmpA family protein n=1 Tax=Porphyromonas TaxID=836 RepID=UPI00055FEB0B|nr:MULTISPECIES: OmpA family protein [Porphyromonas]